MTQVACDLAQPWPVCDGRAVGRIDCSAVYGTALRGDNGTSSGLMLTERKSTNRLTVAPARWAGPPEAAAGAGGFGFGAGVLGAV